MITSRYSYNKLHILMEVRQNQIWQFLYLVLLLSTVIFLALTPAIVKAQDIGTLPVAVTLPVIGATGATGELVVYDENSNTYSVSYAPDQSGVVGVVTTGAPLIFATGESNVPVITSGAAYVRVDNTTEPVERGDLLVSSADEGVAVKAGSDDEEVFAIALENSAGGLVLAQLDKATAEKLLSERQVEADSIFGGLMGSGDGDGDREPGLIRGLFDYLRPAIAAIIAIGALAFLLYTFRSVITNATTSVGRNPRARNAIMMVSIGNLVFTIVVCLIALLVAIGILVLPV